MNTTTSPNALDFGIRKPSETVASLLQENANHEIDWLWAAEQAQDTTERYFCLAYALYINPDNVEARKALQKHLAETREVQTDRPVRGGSLRQLITTVLGG